MPAAEPAEQHPLMGYAIPLFLHDHRAYWSG